jgi:hypothetical protein
MSSAVAEVVQLPAQLAFMPIRLVARLGLEVDEARQAGDDATADERLADLRWYVHMTRPGAR